MNNTTTTHTGLPQNAFQAVEAIEAMNLKGTEEERLLNLFDFYNERKGYLVAYSRVLKQLATSEAAGFEMKA